jgi:hypothetical protein
MGKIFVSYRRSDSAAVALNIAQSLEREFGVSNVFHDIDLKAGERYAETLTEHLKLCSVLLAVIGPNWVRSQNDSGKSRLYDQKDWVRIEILTALQRGIPIIPVLVEGAMLPSPEDLPPELRRLREYQTAIVTTARYRYEISGLIKDLRQVLRLRSHFSTMAPLITALRYAFLGLLIGYALYAVFLLLPTGTIFTPTPTPVPTEPDVRRTPTASPEAGASGLTIVDVGVNEDRQVDIKLKNSSDDAAYITGVRFLFFDGFYSGCAERTCGMMPVGGTLYDFKIRAITGDHSVEVKVDDSQIMPVSQQVPPKGVDRILVRLRLVGTGKAWGYSLTYSFKCRIELIYDGHKRLTSHEFRLAFR